MLTRVAMQPQIRALLNPETSIIALSKLSGRVKLAVFLCIGGVYLLGGFFVANDAEVAWRLFGLFVPIFAALIWGALIGLAIYVLIIPGIYLFVTLRGHEFVGGPSGPLFAITVLVLIGFLRSYIMQLHNARQEIRTLEGIIPICSQCKKIRNDEGFWHRVEEYISRQSTSSFSHGLCPACFNAAMNEFDRTEPKSTS